MNRTGETVTNLRRSTSGLRRSIGELPAINKAKSVCKTCIPFSLFLLMSVRILLFCRPYVLSGLTTFLLIVIYSSVIQNRRYFDFNHMPCMGASTHILFCQEMHYSCIFGAF